MYVQLRGNTIVFSLPDEDILHLCKYVKLIVWTRFEPEASVLEVQRAIHYATVKK